MICIPLPWNRSKWSTISFQSTLYLYPILDLLLVEIPDRWQAEIRLGLQEALVNAAKHGNKLDPNKTIIVDYSISEDKYSWVITDQGMGFIPQCSWDIDRSDENLPSDFSENGRGLCILYEIFDRVDWNDRGTQLSLSKDISNKKNRQPLLL